MCDPDYDETLHQSDPVPDAEQCQCGETVEKLSCCEWQGCPNKCCRGCLTEVFDPVLGDRNRVDTFMVCPDCYDAIWTLKMSAKKTA